MKQVRSSAWAPLRRNYRRMRDATLIITLVCVVAFAGFLGLRPTPRPQPARMSSTVAFIGDSYVGGSNMGGTKGNNFTAHLARQLSCQVLNTARGGTGFVARGAGVGSYQESQFPIVETQKPDFVVVVASRNDASEPNVGQAAIFLFTSIRRALPGVRLLLVGPIWINGEPPSSILNIRDQVKGAAQLLGVPFVDPLEEGWFAGPAASLIGSDGVHPTDDGHLRMARLLGDDLIRLNLL